MTFGGSPFWLYALVMVWGFAVVADSAQFSALVSEHAPKEHIGTALTLQTCVGFLLTMVTIELLPAGLNSVHAPTAQRSGFEQRVRKTHAM